MIAVGSNSLYSKWIYCCLILVLLISKFFKEKLILPSCSRDAAKHFNALQTIQFKNSFPFMHAFPHYLFGLVPWSITWRLFHIKTFRQKLRKLVKFTFKQRDLISLTVLDLIA